MTEGLLDQCNFRIIAAAVEQAFQSEQPYFRRELRVLGSKIPRGAHEGRRLGRVVPRAHEGDVEEPSVFRRGEPLAAVTPRLDQVQQYLPPVSFRISLDRRTIDRKVSRAGGRLQPIAAVGLVGPPTLDQHSLAEAIDRGMVVLRSEE